MIKLTYYDHFTPLIQELIGRDIGLAKESLNVGGSIIAGAARQKMESYTHPWQQSIKNGKRTIWKDDTDSRTLGSRTSHSTGIDGNPKNMSSQIHFVLAKNSPSVSIGGAHKDYRAPIYRDGILEGYMPVVKAVGSKGRAILHKLNTGELNEDHPYRKRKTGFESSEPDYKGRGFMEYALSSTKGAVDAALAKRSGKSFKSAVNNTRTDAKVRQYG